MCRSSSVILLGLLSCAAATAEEIRFHFQPDLDATVERTVRRSTEVRQDEEAYLDESLLRDRWSAENAADGYTIRRTILERSLERNGTPITSPILGAMTDLELIYEVNADGEVSDIQGYRRILEKLKGTLPPPCVAQISMLFNEEGLRKSDIAQWRDELGEVPGDSVELGEMRAETRQIAAPGTGRLDYYALKIYDSWTPCGDGARCLLIRTLYDSNPAALVERAGDGAADALRNVGWDGEPMESAGEVTGEAEKLTDPATMEVYRATSQKKVEAELTLPSLEKTRLEMIETHTAIYQRGRSEKQKQ